MGAQALNSSWSSSRFSLQFTDMAPMKAMKAMKGAAQGMTATAAYSAVAETTGLKVKDVKGVVEGIVAVAAGELKKNGSFKLAGALNMKLKKKPATPARKGVNPFTKERFFQTRRCVEHEAQEKASDASPQGCEPIHKGAMRFQSQASFEDSQGIAYEEVEGDDQLEGLRVREGASRHALVDLRASSLAAVGGLTWLSQGHCIIASPDRGSFAYIG